MICINEPGCKRPNCDPLRCSDYAPTAAEIDRISKEKTTGAEVAGIAAETTTGGMA